jgi:hypothetical protein
MSLAFDGNVTYQQVYGVAAANVSSECLVIVTTLSKFCAGRRGVRMSFRLSEKSRVEADAMMRCKVTRYSA